MVQLHVRHVAHVTHVKCVWQPNVQKQWVFGWVLCGPQAYCGGVSSAIRKSTSSNI